MAVWQATFQLVPTCGFPADYRDWLDEIAPRIRSWSRDIQWWGSEDGDRIDVVLDNGWPMEALVRIDLRELDAQFVESVLGFARSVGFQLLDADGREIQPALDDFMLAVRTSPAFRFVESSVRYMNQLRAGGLDDE